MSIKTAQCSVTIVQTRSGNLQKRTLTLGAKLLIGKESSNDFVINNEGVSATHAELSLCEAPSGRNLLEIRDLSKNGTSVQAVYGGAWTPVQKGKVQTLGDGWKIIMPPWSFHERWPLTVYVADQLTSAEIEELDGECCTAKEVADMEQVDEENDMLERMLEEESKAKAPKRGQKRKARAAKASSSSSSSRRRRQPRRQQPGKRRRSPSRKRRSRRDHKRAPSRSSETSSSSLRRRRGHLSRRSVQLSPARKERPPSPPSRPLGAPAPLPDEVPPPLPPGAPPPPPPEEAQPPPPPDDRQKSLGQTGKQPRQQQTAGSASRAMPPGTSPGSFPGFAGSTSVAAATSMQPGQMAWGNTSLPHAGIMGQYGGNVPQAGTMSAQQALAMFSHSTNMLGSYFGNAAPLPTQQYRRY